MRNVWGLSIAPIIPPVYTRSAADQAYASGTTVDLTADIVCNNFTVSGATKLRIVGNRRIICDGAFTVRDTTIVPPTVISSGTRVGWVQYSLPPVPLSRHSLSKQSKRGSRATPRASIAELNHGTLPVATTRSAPGAPSRVSEANKTSIERPLTCTTSTIPNSTDPNQCGRTTSHA